MPDFLVIGAMKAGTTALWRYLDAHPDIFMPESKEVHYFTAEHELHRGLPWYQSLFAGARSDQVCGEASPGYTGWPMFDGVPERIHAAVPDVRLLYLVRHPIERIVSQYRQEVHGWGESRPLDDAVRDQAVYVWRSRYAAQLQQYLQWFPADQILVVESEELRTHRDATMARVHAFLGVPDRPGDRQRDRIHGAGDQLRVDRGWTRWLRRTRAFEALRDRVPPRVRDAAWRRVASSASPATELDLTLSDETRRWLHGQLLDDLRDLRELLADHGRPFHCWGLLDVPEAG